MKSPIVRILGAHSSPYSGAAVVHAELAARLPQYLPDGWQFEDVRPKIGLTSRLFVPRGDDSTVTILTSTPMALNLRSEHIIPVIYDVRWRWTRGPTSRWYRHADLIRTVRRACRVVTISHSVADQLQALRCYPADRGMVLSLGPGQFQGVEPPSLTEREPSVILVGSAAHKRNELAAALLIQIADVVSRYRVMAVSVSKETRAILEGGIAGDQLEFHQDVGPTDLAGLFARARYYVALGTSEGFGFPYIEAAHQGCDVIAPRQSITIELMGDDAVLLDRTEPSISDLEAALNSWERQRVTRLQRRATSRDWNRAASQLADLIAEAIA